MTERDLTRTQVFTPPAVASFAARLLLQGSADPIRLLDAGAGPGWLAEAVLDSAQERALSVDSATLIEIDHVLAEDARSLERRGANVIEANFIEWATSHNGEPFRVHLSSVVGEATRA
ncbi:hypothetical protein OHB93_05840 [Microbacterium sp. No. 7]|uniref:hypothetical protein n=1 Tax=Microbacterium sp. No. 7 TaxID=1714373 RepID=UPI00300A89DE